MAGKSLVTVTVTDGNLEKALRKFKRKVTDSGHLLEYKERQEFKSPSEIKKERKKKAKHAQYLITKSERTNKV
jgi:small subunit ribosomal protein S21